MRAFRWFREWREWVYAQKVRKEEELERACIAIVTGPGMIEYTIRDVISHVRWNDRNK